MTGSTTHGGTETAAGTAGGAAQLEGPAVCPVGDLQQVLAAVADPVRLEMVRRLASLEPVVCATLYDDIGKSTASHHFKILREAGVIERVSRGAQVCQRLRLAEVEARHPGVLAAILGASVPGQAARSTEAPQPVAQR